MTDSGETPRERESVAAVAGDEQIVGLQRVHGADAGCLLAGGKVAVAADPRGLVLALCLGLEDPAKDHVGVERTAHGRRQRRARASSPRLDEGFGCGHAVPAASRSTTEIPMGWRTHLAAGRC
jgi:hypothetical protein